jgi:hypothetical protein
VLTLGMVTALGGGIIRDILIDSLPPATLTDWRYLAVAAGGRLLAFLFGHPLTRLWRPITVLDAAGLSLFAVTGASKALELARTRPGSHPRRHHRPGRRHHRRDHHRRRVYGVANALGAWSPTQSRLLTLIHRHQLGRQTTRKSRERPCEPTHPGRLPRPQRVAMNPATL